MSDSENHEAISNEQQEQIARIFTLRSAVTKLMLKGNIWFGASLAVIAVALGSKSFGLIWFGGLIVGVIYFYRAFKILLALKELGINQLIPIEKLYAAVAVILIFLAAFVVAPQAYKTQVPSIGTCWAEDGAGVVPVACWSSNANYKTIGYSENESDCAGNALLPSGDEVRFTCLENI